MDKTDTKNGPIYTGMPGGRAAEGRVIDNGATPTPTGFGIVGVIVIVYMSNTHIRHATSGEKKFFKNFF